MTISVSKGSFISAIEWATKFLDSKSDSEFVVLRIGDGTGSVSHMNTDSFMLAPFSIDKNDGAVSKPLALSGRTLKQLLKAFAFANESITLDLSDDESSVLAKSGKSKFRIPVFKSRQIPKPPESTELGEVVESEYFDALSRLSKICDQANEGHIPAIGAVDVAPNRTEGTVTLMATDRYAFGEVTVPFTPAGDTEDANELTHYMIPANVASSLPYGKSSISPVVLIRDEKTGKFGYEFSDGRIALFALKDAEPMAYKKIKTVVLEGATESIITEKENLRKAISVVASMTGSGDVQLSIDGDAIVIQDLANTNEIGVPAEGNTSTDPIRLGFIREIILEAFEPINTAKVKLLWSDSKGKPVVLKPVTDDGKVVDTAFTFATTKV